MTDHIVHFGSKEIRFRLEYNGRKTLGISVTPDLQIIVKAPVGASIEKINQRVIKRAPWILRQEDFFLSFHPRTPARRYVSGESHLFLGRQYVLKVTHGKKNGVHRKRTTIEVSIRKKSTVKAVLGAWYRRQAIEKFSEIAEPLVARFARYKVRPTGLYLQSMRSRWGSCTPKGKIILNPELIKAPRACIEYVITHELCHLIHPHHSAKFFDLQRKMMPDWEKWKEKLERVMA
ncbi:MAG: M48 family metallopeptidase [Bacteroidetes bacterium]|nr:M48 family metallopeptidase [Bacteroidota bacterium]